jgi:uncharacterized lipoprotein YajG
MKYLIILLSVFFIAGCQMQSQPSPSGDQMDESFVSPDGARVGDTSITGQIVKSGERFSIIDSTGKQTEIESYKVSFDAFDGKTVEVTGQYSGDTLFVANITEIQ